MKMPDQPGPDTLPGNRQYFALAAALLGDEAAAQTLRDIDERAREREQATEVPSGT